MKNYNFGSTVGKLAGYHHNCGGEVVYNSTPRMGYRVCEKCKASSLRGNPVILESEAGNFSRESE